MVLKRHVVENLGDVPALLSGTMAERPAPDAGLPGTMFFPTDEAGVYRDTGTGWELQSDSAAMSAADILTAIKTVDGPGSGLDADALDGQQGAYYAAAADLANKADLVGGVVTTSQLPALAINDVFTVASQAAMLALTAQRGDIAVRTDLDPDRTYMLSADDASILANWVRVTFGDVVSVNGQTGVIVLSASDVGAKAIGYVPDWTEITGKPSTFSPSAHATTHKGDGADPIANATTSVAGLESASDKTKLDGVESGATADQSATEIRDALLTVDGAGSGVDADKLDGTEGSGFVQTSRQIATTAPLAGGGDLSADRTLTLANTAVTPGSYTGADITVDAQGRLTAAATGAAGTTPEAWREVGSGGQPAFANSWVNYDASLFQTAAFFKDPFGMVYMKGQMKNGTVGQTAFTLPTGYRPALAISMTAYSSSSGGVPTTSRLDIGTDGTVKPMTGSNAVFALNNVFFRAA